MLKIKYYFTLWGLPIPSIFIVEGYEEVRFKTKGELKESFLFQLNKLVALFKKKVNYKISFYSTKSLSSFDYQIRDKGGIVDCNGNIHTTAQSYKNFLKDNDLVIKDWSDGSNKPKHQLCDRDKVGEIVNQYI